MWRWAGSSLATAALLSFLKVGGRERGGVREGGREGARKDGERREGGRRERGEVGWKGWYGEGGGGGRRMEEGPAHPLCVKLYIHTDFLHQVKPSHLYSMLPTPL
jgi:hypothetical protein